MRVSLWVSMLVMIVWRMRCPTDFVGAVQRCKTRVGAVELAVVVSVWTQREIRSSLRSLWVARLTSRRSSKQTKQLLERLQLVMPLIDWMSIDVLMY